MAIFISDSIGAILVVCGAAIIVVRAVVIVVYGVAVGVGDASVDATIGG